MADNDLKRKYNENSINIDIIVYEGSMLICYR